MEKRTQDYTEEELNEMPVSSEDLLGEIEPLLRDYFVGDILLTERGIEYNLPNGQKFILVASC